MSRGINKVILVGACGNDPDVKYLPNGGAVANVGLATSESWLDKNTGQRQEKTEWHRVVFFGKLADIVSQYVKKGSKLYVEGKLQTRKWQDQAGNDKYTTEIVVDGFSGQMQMLDSQNSGTDRAQSQMDAYGPNGTGQPPAAPQPPQSGAMGNNWQNSAPQPQQEFPGVPPVNPYAQASGG